MARLKIDYGIDLGTTNSAICRMEKGEPVIKKTDTLKDTLPSCVSVTRRGVIKAGDSAFNDMKSDKRRASKGGAVQSNTYVEFKRTMGTDKTYPCSNLNKSFTSEELSAEVLKTIKSFITDEAFHSVVITVPAKFTVNQKTATMNAAKLAGFDHCELLQEPIAASMAYGLTSDQKNGYWMVFDFGGGTFDAALLKVEDGIMQVFDTEGDNYLGGKNLDYAIVDNIIIPYLQENFEIEGILADDKKKEVLRDAMKTYAEDVKNQLSFKDKEDIISNLGDLGEDENGDEIELDLTVTQAEVFDVMRPLFQKAVDICKTLLQRNGMNGSQLNKLILVGGPTHSPLIRQMLKDQVTPNVDTSIDPMTAVATGAALYASTKDADVKESEVQIGTVRLKVGYESTSVETTEWVSVQLDKSVTGSSCPNKVMVELVRGDKAWSSGKVEIDENGNVIEAGLVEGRPNSFSVMAYDAQGNALECFPNEITIIQGSKVGAAPLPYHIGIAVWDEDKERGVFYPATGLEKNKPLPATGVINNRKTTSQLRPGVDSDMLRIPVYQADDYKEGSTAALYEYVADVIVTGDDINTPIKAGSPVDLTLKADSSEQMTLEVFFPEIGESVEKVLDTSKKQTLSEATQFIQKELKNAQNSIDTINDGGSDTADLQQQLEAVKTENQNSSEKKAVLQHLKEVLRKIEDRDSSTEWDRVEKDLREEFERLEMANNDLGNNKTTQLVNQFRAQVDQAIRQKDVKIGRELYKQMDALFIRLTLVYQCAGFIRHHDKNFNNYSWTNPTRARQLINQGLSKLADSPSADDLLPIVRSLLDLLPDDERSTDGLLS